MFPVLSDLLGRLSVGRKLALIYLLDLSAVIFISSILIHEKFVVIDFSRKELAGNAYIRELRPSLVSLADAPMTRGQTDTFSAEVPRIEQRHGAGLKSHDASLDFGRSLSQLRSTTDDARGAAQSAALDKGRALVTRVGNQSNLILDPDLDSYYTMSIVLLRYPELLELVHGITLQMEREATALQPWGNEARTRYLILEGRLDAVAKGIDVDYREAFAASDDALKKSLGPHQARVGTSIERFRQAARATLDASGANGPGRVAQSLQVDDVRRVRRELLVDLDAAWARAGDELDRLLDQRIHGFFVRMALHLGTALLMLAAILSAVWFVARQIAMPLASLADVADGVRRSGDHRLRAQWSSRDEIGRLVTAFNGMLDQLGRERALQDELTARTHAAAAQKDLVEAIPIPLLVTEIPHHGVLHVNAPAQRWLGDVPTDPWAAGLDAPVRARFFQQLADREAVDEFEVQWRTAGEPVWAVLSARRLLYQGRDALLTTFTPVNHLKAMEQRLELWAKVFEASTESIVILDAQHRILTVNRAFSRHTGFDAGDAAGEGIGFLLADEADASTMNDLWPNVDKRGAWQGEISVRRRNGSRYPAWVVMSVVRAAADRISHYIVSSLDISDRKASEERIRYLAHHDTLTGLPNRSLCNERLRLAMQQAERSGHKVAVLFIDLDRFKTINDSLGHHVGDELLRSVSQRLQAAVRSGDTVSRLGGDEFIVVLSRVDNIDEVVTVVEHRLVPGIREKHDVGGAELHVSCSIGIAIYPDDARDIDEVLRHADVAMYQAKALGRDAVHFFTPELNARAHRRLRIESLLRQATDRGELTLHYQPCIAADGTAVIGFEALIRWTSPELGPVAPTEFIAIAEESRLIRHIGQWVIEQTCRDQAAWRAQGLADVAVSVNLSALQLRDDTLVATLHDAMRRHGTRPQSIELELTESTLMETVDHTLAQLDALRALGVTLSIDDFGTGYSSLSYLKRFPIDRLKIDSSFVRDMLVDTADAEIIRAIVALGHSLGLRVVAEGVENEDTARALRVAGCDELQGFYIARPMPADQVMQWLREARVTAQAQALVRSDQD